MQDTGQCHNTSQGKAQGSCVKESADLLLRDGSADRWEFVQSHLPSCYKAYLYDVLYGRWIHGDPAMYVNCDLCILSEYATSQQQHR